MTALDRNHDQSPVAAGGGASGGGGESGPGRTLYIQGVNKDEIYSGSKLIDVINDMHRNDAPEELL